MLVLSFNSNGEEPLLLLSALVAAAAENAENGEDVEKVGVDVATPAPPPPFPKTVPEETGMYSTTQKHRRYLYCAQTASHTAISVSHTLSQQQKIDTERVWQKK